MRNAIKVLMVFALVLPLSGKGLSPPNYSDQINTFPTHNTPDCCPDEAGTTEAAQKTYQALVGGMGQYNVSFRNCNGQ